MGDFTWGFATREDAPRPALEKEQHPEVLNCTCSRLPSAHRDGTK